jgi:hypothetical protein
MTPRYFGFALMAAALPLFFSCATPGGAFKAGYDFSKIHSISIGEFSSSADQPNSGSVVAGEFAQELLSLGYSVKTSAQDTDIDAVIEGDVTEYLPNSRYLIPSSVRAGRGAVVVQQPMPIGGSNVYNQGTSMGPGGGEQVVVSNATVGVSVRMKDSRTGEVIWANSYTYEGLDLNSALEGAVRYLLSGFQGRGK